MDESDAIRDEQLYPTGEACVFLGVTPRALQDKVHRQVIQARCQGHKYYFLGAELRRYMNSLPVKGRQARQEREHG